MGGSGTDDVLVNQTDQLPRRFVDPVVNVPGVPVACVLIHPVEPVGKLASVLHRPKPTLGFGKGRSVQFQGDPVQCLPVSRQCLVGFGTVAAGVLFNLTPVRIGDAGQRVVVALPGFGKLASGFNATCPLNAATQRFAVRRAERWPKTSEERFLARCERQKERPTHP